MSEAAWAVTPTAPLDRIHPARPMTEPIIEVLSEREQGPMWVFSMRHLPSGRTCEMAMSWADYDLWSPEGAHAPSEVACAAAEVLVEALLDAGVQPPARTDVSLARRHRANADALIRARLR
jgi:hypothetical protein